MCQIIEILIEKWKIQKKEKCVYEAFVSVSLHSPPETGSTSMFSSATCSLGVWRSKTLRYTCIHAHTHAAVYYYDTTTIRPWFLKKKQLCKVKRMSSLSNCSQTSFLKFSSADEGTSSVQLRVHKLAWTVFQIQHKWTLTVIMRRNIKFTVKWKVIFRFFKSDMCCSYGLGYDNIWSNNDQKVVLQFLLILFYS